MCVEGRLESEWHNLWLHYTRQGCHCSLQNNDGEFSPMIVTRIGVVRPRLERGEWGETASRHCDRIPQRRWWVKYNNSWGRADHLKHK